jgi:hypothetical protein
MFILAAFESTTTSKSETVPKIVFAVSAALLALPALLSSVAPCKLT